MTSNYCYLTENKIYSIPDFPQKLASWLIRRQMLYGQLRRIRSEKFLTCFQTGKHGRKNNGILGYLMAESEGHASLSLQHCVLQKRVHFGVEE